MTTDTLPVADLEPSLAFEKTYVSRRRTARIDAAALLSVMTVLIALIPARYIVPGMTDVGRPGLVVGLLLFFWWVVARASPNLVMTGPQPMRWAMLVLLLDLLISYTIGYMRGLTSMESNSADRTMLFFFVFIGIGLTAADGIPNWYRLRGVLKVMVVCAAIVALIGLGEYVTQSDLTRYLAVPGLQAKGWTPNLMLRDGAYRVASTTNHYIELAAFLALIQPFAIHFAVFSQRPRRRRLAIVASLLIAAGNATTISRTGIVGLALMLVVLVPLWPWRLRYNIFAATLGFVAVLGASKPSLYRSLIRLFSNTKDNSSINARTSRYPLAFHYIAERPWLGRGTGTWVSPQYQIMDNQWLDTLITNGFIGAAILAGVSITGIALAGKALKRSTSREDKHLCACLISTQLIGLVAAGTFDSLAFYTYAIMLALTLGMCGTVWRLTHPARTVRTSITRWYLDQAPPKQPAPASRKAMVPVAGRLNA